MIYLLTAIGLTPDGSSTVHIYTQTRHRRKRSIDLKHGGRWWQYTERHNKREYL